MVSDGLAQQSVDEAWLRFAKGDVDGAIALAQAAAQGDAAPAAACAALGYFLIQADRIDDAAAVLLPACERAPDHAPLHWYRGYLQTRRGDTEGAAVAFGRACALDASLDEAAFDLAWALHELGRVNEAAAWAAHALQRKRSPDRLLLAAWLQQCLRLDEHAVALYREAIQGFHSSAAEQPRLHLHLSQCLLRLGREDEADGVLQRALDQWPLDPQLAVEWIWRQRAQGDLQEALRRVKDLLRERPAVAAAWHVLGVLQQDQGDLRAADAAFAEVQQLDLGLTDALVRRALIQRQWKQFEGARWLLGLVLDRAPTDPAARHLLAQVLLDLDRDDEARRLLIGLLRSGPPSTGLRRLLAVTQARRGRVGLARRTLHSVLAEEPGNVEALRLQGWLAHEQGDAASAAQVVRQLLAVVPDDADAQVQAAFILVDAGCTDEAQIWAERAVAHAPDVVDAWRALSHVRLRQRWLNEAELAVVQALRLAPAHTDSLRQLGRVMMAAARHGQAQLAFLRAVESRPGDAVLRLELAQARYRAGHFMMGLDGLNAVLEQRPGWYPALLLKARLMVEGGIVGAADACGQLLRNDRHAPDAVKTVLRLSGLGNAEARRLLAMVPLDVLRSALRDAIADASHTHGQASFQNLVQLACDDLDEDPWTETASLYSAFLSAQTDAGGLALQARDWYRGLKIRSGLARLSSQMQPGGDRRPRIAYVASQLHQSLLRRVLAAHCADRAHVFLYTNQPHAGLPAHVHVQPLVPETLAQTCAANRIDVVIDAGGLHPFEGQFGVLQAYAHRVAPVQIGWLGCWGSAGGLFDALLADDVSVPDLTEDQYEETVFRLQGSQWCWDPPLATPEVSQSPVLELGSITYGVTARSLKLGPACLDTFARIVAATAQSAIRFIGAVADDWPLRRDILARMQAHGVTAGRVFFDPFMSHSNYLDWFSRIDLVLDSFPGNGGLSLFEPLWMGVPVVTLAGRWAGARQGASVLTGLGLQSFVTDSDDGFCATAIALAHDTAALSGHRSTLRARVLNSPLVDGRRVASQIESICARLKESSFAAASAPDGKARTKAQALWALDSWLATSAAIDLPVVQPGVAPELSVILVLFNQAGLSRRTLQALADQRGATFETIVVDNASTDRTTELLARLRGARVIRNQNNEGFLRAARQGAAVASGRTLAFLNSDAILQKGTLQAALEAIQADPGIGALGGRVVLTDGGLQEAGNRIFRDGSAAGIGRGEDAFGHAARAARSTDYVSGVFLVTPAALWHRLGGFDEAFAPAYYEDTDYCVRVWQAGLRVVYQPSVLLEHLEWGSATGDSAALLMERNRKLFRVRHGAWLQSQPRPQAQSLDGDRWCSPEDRDRRPRVLFLDNEVPHTFKGGGLPRARLMLQALRDWPVTFFPLWAPHDDWRAVYASLPRSVEVALGHGLDGLESFLERRRGVYDVLVVSRPPNLQALGRVRKRRPELFAGMRLVYDAEALFALREIAMAAVQARPFTRAAARARIDAEIALADGASDVLVVSNRDARHFEAAGHRTHVLSHAIPVRRGAPGPTGRRGLLFVGALHPGTPNEDGLLWFIREVMPRLRQRASGMPVLSVVGVCLSDQIVALAGSDVKVLGPRDALEPYYDAARLFIAPVRFAGGVPAKVIEAAAAGIPTVASALLVKQLGWRDGFDILGARDAQAFAAAVTLLLDDDAAWERQQRCAWQQCASLYDPQIFGSTLHKVLGGVRRPATAGER